MSAPPAPPSGRRPAPVLERTKTRPPSGPRPLPSPPGAPPPASAPPPDTPDPSPHSAAAAPHPPADSSTAPAAARPRSAVAAYAFAPPPGLPHVGPGSDPVPLAKGERVSGVVPFAAEGWVRVVRASGEEGIVPESYLKFDAPGAAPEPGRAPKGRQGTAKYAFEPRAGTTEIRVKAGEVLQEVEDAEAADYVVATNAAGDRGLLPRAWVSFSDPASGGTSSGGTNDHSDSWVTRQEQEAEDERLARELQAQLDMEATSAASPAEQADEALARRLQEQESAGPSRYPTAEVEKDRILAERLQREMDEAKEETVEDFKTFFADEALARELQERMQREAEEEALRHAARTNHELDPGRFPAPLAPAPDGAVSDASEIPNLVRRHPPPAEEAARVLSLLQAAGEGDKTADGKPTPARKRNLALLDLLQSENTFLLSLRTLLTSVFDGFPALIGAEGLVDDAFVRSGICDVYLLHVGLLTSLLAEVAGELASGTPARVGLQFVRMRGDFAVYSRYIAHYHRLSPALRRIAEWNTAFENDLRRTGGVGGVAEMWFLPVQRVMRYGMVLGAILKTTKSLDAALEAPDGPKPPPYQPPHPDIPSLNQAISQCVALSDVVNSIQARSEKREAAAKLPDIEGWDARELGFGEMPGGQDRLVEFEGEGTEDLLGPVRVWVATDLLAIAVVATPDGRLAKASAAKGKESWRLWRALDVRDLALEQGANGKVRVKFGDRQRGDGSSTYPRAYKPRSSIGRPPEPAPMGEERSYAFEMANERARRGFEEALRAVIAAAKARPLPEGNWYAVKARAGSLDAKDMSAIPGFRSSDPFVVVRLVSKWPSAPRDVAPVAAPGVYRMDATGSTYVVPKDGQTGGEVLDPRERLQFLGRSQTVYKSLSPSFAEFGFFLPPYAAGSKLQIEVWDEDEDTKSDFIGAVRVGADELLGSRGLSWGIVNEAERDRRRKAGENYINSGVVTVMEVRKLGKAFAS